LAGEKRKSPEKKLSNLIFFKFSPSIRGVKYYIVLNFGGHLAPQFWGKMGQISNFAPYISKTGGIGGLKFFSSDRGPSVLLIETLGSGHFLTPEFLGNLIIFLKTTKSILPSLQIA